jgi:hypothetical protein
LDSGLWAELAHRPFQFVRALLGVGTDPAFAHQRPLLLHLPPSVGDGEVLDVAPVGVGIAFSQPVESLYGGRLRFDRQRRRLVLLPHEEQGKPKG